jgi:hypothetical protein
MRLRGRIDRLTAQVGGRVRKVDIHAAILGDSEGSITTRPGGANLLVPPDEWDFVDLRWVPIPDRPPPLTVQDILARLTDEQRQFLRPGDAVSVRLRDWERVDFIWPNVPETVEGSSDGEKPPDEPNSASSHRRRRKANQRTEPR